MCYILLNDYKDVRILDKIEKYLIKAKCVGERSNVLETFKIFDIIWNNSEISWEFVCRDFEFMRNETYIIQFCLKNKSFYTPTITSVLYNVSRKEWLV